ncbi:hypothetical protein [Nostoc sp. FACHB-888]|nr:hypothetical protein [Nostoc sp. FACHB-888]
MESSAGTIFPETGKRSQTIQSHTTDKGNRSIILGKSLSDKAQLA